MKMTTAMGLLLGLLLITTATAEQFYKWTDEAGVTHYSADPPPKSVNNASEVKVGTKLPSGSTQAIQSLEKQRNDAKKSADKADKDAKKEEEKKAKSSGDSAGKEKYAEKCQKLQTDLQTIQDHSQIRVMDEKGESRILTSEERDSRLDDVQREMKAYCQ